MNQVLREGLEAVLGSCPREPFEPVTHSMGELRVSHSDKLVQAASELEDEEVERKQDLRK